MPVSRSMYNDWSRAKQSQRDAQKQYKLVKLRKDGQPSKMADDTRLFGSREDAIKHAENIDSLNPGRDYRYHLHTGHEGTAGHHKAYIRVVNGRAEEVAEKSETIDELQKAIDEAAMAGVLMLRKSQMSFDFASTNPHHVAYTRTNASGTVSNIKAKGSAPAKPQIDHAARRQKKLTYFADTKSSEAFSSSELHDHRRATEAHRAAAEAYPKGSSQRAYHNSVANNHSDIAERLDAEYSREYEKQPAAKVLQAEADKQVIKTIGETK